MAANEINEGLNYITYGLYIVTSFDGEKKNGLIVNTVFQVTAQPAQVAISVNKNSLTHDIITKSRVFAAMPLEQESTLPFIGIFGFRSGKTFDKFSKVPYKTGFLGCPIVTEHTLSYMEVEVNNTVDLGTHTLIIGVAHIAGVLKQAGALPHVYYDHVLKDKTLARGSQS